MTPSVAAPSFRSLSREGHPRLSTRLARFFVQSDLPTPLLAIDGEGVEGAVRRLRRAFRWAEVLYAAKANPMPEVLALVSAGGLGVDVASGQEIRQCLTAGIPATRMSFGNTVKHPNDIALAHRLGIDRFTIDSQGELEKVAQHAPGARVLVRLQVHTVGAQWPLSRKFGCDEDTAVDLLHAARGAGLEPYGLAFHVGSQQQDPTQWDAPIATCARIAAALRRDGLRLAALNVGGGLPARYVAPVPSPDEYAEAIRGSLERHFGRQVPQVIVEPGRAVVAESGALQTTVLLASMRQRNAERQWVYIDCGKFGGLAETMDEAIRYPVLAPAGRGVDVPTVLAGPTCDSADVLYERTACHLPTGLRSGDRLYLLSTGAYTLTYASVGFNGFAPLRGVFL